MILLPKLLPLFVLYFVLQSDVYAQTVKCDNYNSQIIKRIDLESFNVGKQIYQGKQQKQIVWTSLFDLKNMDDMEGVTCEEITTRNACWGEAFVPVIYPNNVIIEKGQSNDWYVLYDDFPELKNGIAPKMTRQQIVSKLGKPVWETDNYLQYQSKSMHGMTPLIEFFFLEEGLWVVSFRVWKGACVE